MALYLDTSVLVSLYVPEPQSQKALQLIQSSTESLYISQLAQVEFYSALNIKKRMKTLSTAQCKKIIEQLTAHINHRYFSYIHLNDNTYQLAQSLLLNTKVALRSLDALHLASAQQTDAKLITADKTLFEAALSYKTPTELL